MKNNRIPHSFVAKCFETAINHHICLVGIITVQNGEITDEYHALINATQ